MLQRRGLRRRLRRLWRWRWQWRIDSADGGQLRVDWLRRVLLLDMHGRQRRFLRVLLRIRVTPVRKHVAIARRMRRGANLRPFARLVLWRAVKRGRVTILCVFERIGTTAGARSGRIGATALGRVQTPLVVVGGRLVPDLELVDSLGALALGGRQRRRRTARVGRKVDAVRQTALHVAVGYGRRGARARLLRVHRA